MKLPKLLTTTLESRRVYPLALTVNGKKLESLVIDPHFEKNHPYMSDEKIWEMVKFLNNKKFIPTKYKEKWEIFETDILYSSKNYRLVWCLEVGKSYLGIIHCYRKSKYDQSK